jgi:hypothetical protein
VLIDEAADLIERTPSIAHIVVDEAQDLSPMEVRAIGRRCATGAATVLGDLAQGTTPWAATSWPDLLAHLGKPGAAVRELDVGYRVPRQILDFASRLLPSIAAGLSPAVSLRADPDALRVRPVPPGQLGALVAGECVTALDRPGSVAVICADAQLAETGAALRAAGLAFGVLGDAPGEADGADGAGLDAGAGLPTLPTASAPPTEASRLTLVPVTLAKGLEFDHVILVEPGRIATGEAYGLRRLYVALTRAVSRLTVFHAEPLPAELALHTIGGRTFSVPGARASGLRGEGGAKGFVGPDKLARPGILVMPIARVPRQDHPETVRACLGPGEPTISSDGDVLWKLTETTQRQLSTSTSWPKS